MKYFVTVGGRETEIDVDGDHVVVAGERIPATLSTLPGSPLRQLIVGGRSVALPMEPRGRGRGAGTGGGERREVEVVDERTRHIRSLTGDADRKAGPMVLKAPMPGLVVRVQVEAGQTVAAGTPLVILEAMKMENQLTAAGPATILAVRVEAGAAVEKGQVLIELGP